MAPLAAQAAVPLDAASAIARLNAIRAANGIPGGLVEDSVLSQGCALHSRYMLTGSNYVGPGPFAPHGELPGQPNATDLGARAAGVSDLMPGFTHEGARAILADPLRMLWDDAPLHLAALIDPSATTAWFGSAVGRKTGAACMGTNGTGGLAPADGGPAAPVPVFHSLPGNGATNVPFATTVHGEWPENPAVVAGLREGSQMGPVVYLFSSAAGRVVDATVSGPAGPVPVVRPPEDSRFIFFPRRLAPRTTYRVAVAWDIETHFPGDPVTPPLRSVQEFSFTTGTRDLTQEVPTLYEDVGMTFAVRRVGSRLRITLGAGKALGRRATLSFLSLGYPRDPIQRRRGVLLRSPKTIVTWPIPRRVLQYGNVSVRLGVGFIVDGIAYTNSNVRSQQRILKWKPRG